MDGLRRATWSLLAAGGANPASRWTPIGDWGLHHIEQGEGNPVVLLHGAGGGSANWYAVLPALAERFRVLAPDLPGFGLSPAVDPVEPLGEWVAGIVARWLAALDVGRCSVVGTSFGGLVALRLAQRCPELIDRLVLVAAAGLGREIHWLVRLAGTRPFSWLAVRPGRAGAAWLLDHLLTASRTTPDRASRRVLAEYLYQSAAHADGAAVARAYRCFTAFHGQREILDTEALRSIDVPTLVVWGARDSLLPPRHGSAAAEAIPGARLTMIPDAGHSPNWEAPATLALVLRSFLEDAVEARGA